MSYGNRCRDMESLFDGAAWLLWPCGALIHHVVDVVAHPLLILEQRVQFHLRSMGPVQQNSSTYRSIFSSSKFPLRFQHCATIGEHIMRHNCSLPYVQLPKSSWFAKPGNLSLNIIPDLPDISVCNLPLTVRPPLHHILQPLADLSVPF